MLRIPTTLAENCHGVGERAVWLDRLPGAVRRLAREWSLTLGEPFESEAGWVAPAVLEDGSAAVLKLGMPHYEALDEAAGLVFWNGDPVVRVLAVDSESGGMLLERCEPGTTLRDEPEEVQDVVIAGLLNRLWRLPADPHGFRTLAEMTRYWSAETLAARARWPDAGLVREGLRLFETLPASAPREVLLATDLHAGNVLRALREPWLVIDPKPFVGDPAYDVTQHLLNCRSRFLADCRGAIRRMADMVELDEGRIRLWMFARAAAEPREHWDDSGIALARPLAP